MAGKIPQAKSVIFEVSHPLRPVGRLDAARSGPVAGRIIPAVPFERPQLLEGHLARGPVGEETMLRPAVPVDTEPLHLVIARSQQRCTVTHFGWIIRGSGPSIHPPAFGKNRDAGIAPDLMSPPVVLGWPPPPEAIQSGRDIAHPAVWSVAAFISAR